MRTGTFVLVALATLGLVVLDGLVAGVGADGLVTGEAAASCIEDGVTGQCHSLCVPPPRPDWACPM